MRLLTARWTHAPRGPTGVRARTQVAMGFVHVANEAMCRPIRALTQMRGYDVAQHVLACFGGAGGQHACAIARNLGMRTVFVHRYAGVLSAVGIALADVVAEEQARRCKLRQLGAAVSYVPECVKPHAPGFAPGAVSRGARTREHGKAHSDPRTAPERGCAAPLQAGRRPCFLAASTAGGGVHARLGGTHE
jgi:hypothetical protein